MNIITPKLFSELVRLFPEKEASPVYPYNFVIDGNSYCKKEYDKLQEMLDDYPIFLGWCTYIKYDFPTSLVYAIQNDDAELITEHKFDISKFPKKFHKNLSYMEPNVRTMNELIESLQNKQYKENDYVIGVFGLQAVIFF
jgi:hypothetical protein